MLVFYFYFFVGGVDCLKHRFCFGGKCIWYARFDKIFRLERANKRMPVVWAMMKSTNGYDDVR